jgi:hypothetical protein
MRFLTLVLLAALAPAAAHAFFDFGQMFGNQGGHHHGQQQQQQQQHQRGQNAPSDPGAYQRGFDNTPCDNYLCPDTLACVHFPHHCPCPWESHEDKVETGPGHRLCASKGGSRAGQTPRKVELARKGLL